MVTDVGTAGAVNFQVNVFNVFGSPLPPDVYTGGPLPFSGPTSLAFNPLNPASFSLIPQQPLFFSSALPTQATCLGIAQGSSPTVNPVSVPGTSLTASSSSQVGARQITTDDSFGAHLACLLFIQTGCATDRLGELFGAGPEFFALGLGLNVDHSKINKQAKKLKLNPNSPTSQ